MIHKIFHYMAYFFSLSYLFFSRIFESSTYNIKRDDIVLDVGGGNRPLLRSNIVLDKYMFNDYERPSTGTLRRNKYRHLIIGDCVHLPFKNKSIDFLYCRNLLEHIKEIDIFISEIQRVARRGVLIAPSILNENFDNQYFHCWLIKRNDNKLIFQAKQNTVQNVELNQFVNKVIALKTGALLMLFRLYYDKFFKIVYRWEETIKYEVIGQPIISFTPAGHHEDKKITKTSLGELAKWHMYQILTFLFFRRRVK